MKKISILIVDDEKAVGESLSMILQDEGYECFFTDDGYRAIHHIESQPVDILITDIHMPKMDGLTLVRKTSQLRPDIAIIVITAYNETELFSGAIESSIADILVKPLDFDEVIKIIKRLVRQHKSTARD